MDVELPRSYRPSPDEGYMNELQKEYFRRKLLVWRQDLLEESGETLEKMLGGDFREPDLADRGSLETDTNLELRTRDRYRKLVAKIDEALQRIEDGTYGYCEETGKPIGLKRLEARPVATLSIEAQKRHEHREQLESD